MDPLRTEALTDALRAELGDGLRAVAVGSVPDREYEISYMRADIDELYTDEMRENIFDEIVLEHIAEARQKDLFPPLGRLDYTVRLFEDGINLVGWTDEIALFVGLDPDESLIPTAIAACREQL